MYVHVYTYYWISLLLFFLNIENVGKMMYLVMAEKKAHEHRQLWKIEQGFYVVNIVAKTVETLFLRTPNIKDERDLRLKTRCVAKIIEILYGIEIKGFLNVTQNRFKFQVPTRVLGLQTNWLLKSIVQKNNMILFCSIRWKKRA